MMGLLSAAFRAAVNHVIDERNKETRRIRALERGAAAAERIAEELQYFNDGHTFVPPQERKP